MPVGLPRGRSGLRGDEHNGNIPRGRHRRRISDRNTRKGQLYGMNYFLSGGAKNGKSSLAQQIVCAQGGPHYYLATMIPHDDEDWLRIRRHLENRAGLGFQTVECGTDILASLSQMDPDGAVLLDSVTALLSNEMFRADGTMDVLAPARLEAELLEFSRRMRCCVFVSDFIYADGGQYDAWTECYRRGLAALDRALAAACENAAELCCAQAYWYKGGFAR